MSGDPKHPELIPHTFGNGVQVWLRKVPPLLINELNRSFPAPKPPLEDVDYGDGVVRKESNPTRPDYRAQLAEHYQEMGLRLLKLLISQGVKYTLTDEDKAEVFALRQAMEEQGVMLSGDEKIIFIAYVCCDSEEETNRFRTAVMRRSQPTEEAVQEAVDSFRSDV